MSRPMSTTTQDAAGGASCCSKTKSHCTTMQRARKHASRSREIGMAAMTAMAMFGPRRFRPYFQHVLAVISVVTATVQFFRRHKDA